MIDEKEMSLLTKMPEIMSKAKKIFLEIQQ